MRQRASKVAVVISVIAGSSALPCCLHCNACEVGRAILTPFVYDL